MVDRLMQQAIADIMDVLNLLLLLLMMMMMMMMMLLQDLCVLILWVD